MRGLQLSFAESHLALLSGDYGAMCPRNGRPRKKQSITFGMVVLASVFVMPAACILVFPFLTIGLWLLNNLARVPALVSGADTLFIRNLWHNDYSIGAMVQYLRCGR